MAKLPSAYLSGVRLKSISDSEVVAKVKFRWINQNPFKSLYWATQGMASELTTGIIVMREIAESGKRISMLVTKQQGEFLKKAKGTILFSCVDTDMVKTAIAQSIATGKGQQIILVSKGVDEAGDTVSSFSYEWSIKLRT
ncbi:DUF4442 domain-containing protein [Urechidicola vernalis]|uniref:DUF4442 domain-containing protein n=1 Tax=Urechidicola vernalis TaxID=3075600 RepID=A0ABU2Y3J1_9FLAO|nr:DUF4442 domain-containing protein [Urechidicola sp. P050]MDT0552725.1 DUF4442 domain-containing protein [Urechidicola sp. P050]